MPGEIQYGLRGAREMEELLKKLGPEISNKLGDAALRAGAKPIVEEAKRLVPVRSGELRDAIAARVQRRTARDERVIHIGFLRPVSARAHLTEFGTARSAAKPFMRPAMDSRASAALGEMGKSLARGIAREAKKLAKPAR